VHRKAGATGARHRRRCRAAVINPSLHLHSCELPAAVRPDMNAGPHALRFRGQAYLESIRLRAGIVDAGRCIGAAGMGIAARFIANVYR
jgi:hypothetical protein